MNSRIESIQDLVTVIRQQKYAGYQNGIVLDHINLITSANDLALVLNAIKPGRRMAIYALADHVPLSEEERMKIEAICDATECVTLFAHTDYNDFEDDKFTVGSPYYIKKI